MDISSFDPQIHIPNLSGKVYFVTGGTTGLGKQSVLTFVRHNAARVYFTGRNEAGAQAVIDEAKQVTSKFNTKTELIFLRCDFQDLSTVAAAAERFDSDRLDALLCNSGIMAVPPGLTSDGYEVQFGVNHVAHALLIKKLLPTLLATSAKNQANVSTAGEPARIIILTSLGMKATPSGGIVFDSIKTTQGSGMFSSTWLRYGQSKLANVLYAAELARRQPSLLSVSIHPGVVSTGLVSGLGVMKKAFVYASQFGNVIEPEKGAYNQCWAATTADFQKIENGAFYEPVGKLGEHTKNSKSKELAQKLWEWTEVELEKYS